MEPTLTLPPVPLWWYRIPAALACAATLLVLLVAPVQSEAGGDQHHMFNPSVQIDQTQIEVRGHGTR